MFDLYLHPSFSVSLSDFRLDELSWRSDFYHFKTNPACIFSPEQSHSAAKVLLCAACILAAPQLDPDTLCHLGRDPSDPNVE